MKTKYIKNIKDKFMTLIFESEYDFNDEEKEFIHETMENMMQKLRGINKLGDE